MKKLYEDFIEYKMDIEGRSAKSLTDYVDIVKQFCKDMKIKNYEDFINVKAQDIKNWLSSLVEKGNSPVTRNKKLTSIKQIFVYLEEEKMVEVDRNIFKIKYAKSPTKETKYLTKDEMEELLAVIPSQKLRAVVSVLSNTGLRFEELLQITCSDIERGFIVVTGKGNKQRTVWFVPSCLKECKRFINGDRKRYVENSKVETDLLFIGINGNLIAKQNITESLKHYAKKMGLYWWKEMSPHKFRHSYLTEQLNKGVPISIVRDMAGHSNISTTNRYAHSNQELVRKAMLGELELDEYKN